MVLAPCLFLPQCLGAGLRQLRNCFGVLLIKCEKYRKNISAIPRCCVGKCFLRIFRK